MKAIVYSGPRNVEVKRVPDPQNHRDDGWTKVVIKAAA
jgi:Alcohol dehydrogenase GroES-associated